jgi:hypothetical protein
MGVIDAGISRKERIYKIARHQGYLPFLKEKNFALVERQSENNVSTIVSL